MISYYDADKSRYRIAVAYPGEDGIEFGKTYKLDNSHKFVEVTQ